MSGTFLTGGGASVNQERLLSRYVVGSPFRADPVTAVDTASALSCPEPGCGSRFITIGGKSAEQHLAAHVERGHAERTEHEQASARRKRAYRAKAAAQE
jgi:hypothetical protein